MTNEVKTTRNLKVIGQSGYRYQARLMPKKIVKFIDLFSGMGGIRLGFEQAFQNAGYQRVFVCAVL